MLSKSVGKKKPCRDGHWLLLLEALEDRSLPSTFTVLNLNDGGAGSLRQAVLDANSAAGADLITFAVAGTIRLTGGALPAVTGEVDIPGGTAPGFAGTPVVEVDYNGFGGLRFDAGSAGSALRSLGHVNAAGAGITLDGRGVLVVGNFVGLRSDGVTVAGNGRDGLRLTASASGNTVGGVTSRDRNVISGNLGHGVAVEGASRNHILGNFIGTDATGTLDRGNGGNGIVLAGRACENRIGGVVPANPPGTKPPDFSGDRPPEGNLISGNGGNGVLLTGGARANFLAGNFVGTSASGVSALGNALDGVAIVDGSDGNVLAGTFEDLHPFIFYNVVGGNGGNGLRVCDSDGTVVHANFFGLGSDDKTAVGNALDGVVVEGSSRNTVFGGVIPLGNVVAANHQNGVVVKDTARGFESFNTFAGVAAFSDDVKLGNALDGFLITSTGGDNVIRTSVISRNGDDGVEISGDASGVQVVQNIIGVNTAGGAAMGNADNGVEIGGNAHDNVIGGPQPTFSIIPQNAISANGGHGVAVVGYAHDNRINFSYIGTGLFGQGDLGNKGSGVLLSEGTSSTTIGSTRPEFRTVISGNGSHGIEMRGTSGNTLVGTYIGTGVRGLLAMPNGGDGVHITDSSDNMIGGTRSGEGNVIAHNIGSGTLVLSGDGNGIRANSIHTNAFLGIDLAPGANADQPAPVLTSADRLPGGVRVTGTLTSHPNTWFTIEVFADSGGDTLGGAEGRVYLGSVRERTNAAGVASFTFVGRLPLDASFITATATDLRENTSEFGATTLTSTPASPVGQNTTGMFAVGGGPGRAEVTVHNPDGSVAYTVTPFDPAEFPGGVRAAVADVTGDGVPDLVVGSGPGGPPVVKVFDGATRVEIASFDAFEPAFTGGVSAAAGDVTGDGRADLVVTPGNGGGPRVRVFSGDGFGVIADFWGLDDPNFRGGVNAVLADLNGAGVADLIVGAGEGGGPRVAAYDGASLTSGRPRKLFADFSAFEPGQRGGVFVTGGDVDGDGTADLITGAGAGGGPRVRVLDGQTLQTEGIHAALANPLADFFAGNAAGRGGIHLAAKDLDGDGRADIVTGGGTGQGISGIEMDDVAELFNIDVESDDDEGIFVG
jgi:hypothetical protein